MIHGVIKGQLSTYGLTILNGIRATIYSIVACGRRLLLCVLDMATVSSFNSVITLLPHFLLFCFSYLNCTTWFLKYI